eukprot:TRINITY_DN3280_c0_g1_i3.p1 TRINITY_DN3280_c0_g1~~TRINITY_DN3280_c0_g1_i3.p1  ORF type:complete len:868 (+),score=278.65 TRINITY_DN3280_c0_g1_i3:47-2650(+)
MDEIDSEWTIEINGTEMLGDKHPFTVYHIHTIKGEEQWQVSKRYREARLMDEKLRIELPSLCSQLDFPPRKFSGKFKPEFIEERRQKLEFYLKQIIGIPELSSSASFTEFIFGPDSVPDEDDSSHLSSSASDGSDSESSAGTVKIRRKNTTHVRSSSDIFWVKGMNIEAHMPHLPSPDGDFRIRVGDVVTFCGERNEAGKGKVSFQGKEGWVLLANFQVCGPPSFLDSDQVGRIPVRESVGKGTASSPAPTRKMGLDRSNKDLRKELGKGMKIGEFRSGSDTDLRKIGCSKQTLQKVAACKQFLDEYYFNLNQYLQQRMKRHNNVMEKIETLGENSQAAQELLKQHRNKETSILRRRRKKITFEDFEILEMIGKGGFGKVYLTRERSTGEIMALKKIKKQIILERNKVESIRTERDVLKLSHKQNTVPGESASPWLVKLIFSFQDPEHLYLAMEYAPGGNLKTLLANVIFPEKEAKHYIGEMILAVGALHRLGYVHRDLKPDNFLFDKMGHIKLADFGLSKGGIVKKVEIPINPIRVYMMDGTFKTLAVHPEITAGEIIDMVRKKLDFSQGSQGSQGNEEYSLFLQQGAKERKLKTHERPENLMAGWLHHSGDFTSRSPSPLSSSGSTSPRGPQHRLIFVSSKEDVNRAHSSSTTESVGTPPETGRRPTSLTMSRFRALSTDLRKTRRLQAQKWANTEKAYSFVGSPHYMAPEIIMKNGYDELVDWWSLGCILYECIVGFPPFSGETPQEVFGNILDHEACLIFPEDDDDEVNMGILSKDLIERLLSPAEFRLGSLSDIKKHSFFRGLEWTNLRNMIPPFVPKLSSDTDTSYFHMEDEENNNSSGSFGDTTQGIGIPRKPKDFDFPG